MVDEAVSERLREIGRMAAERERVRREGMQPRPDCVFCNLDRIATPIEDDWFSWTNPPEAVMVFEPLNPVTPGHLLVVPRAHVPDAAADHRIAAATMDVAASVARRYESANIITSIGEDATQTVMHLHLHVVPRHPGDGLRLPWSPDAPQQAAEELHLHRP